LGEIEGRHRLIRVDAGENLGAGIRKAAQVIKSGGVVAFPTESFYGLAININDEEAIERLFSMKKREADLPILILIPSIGVLDRYVRHVPDIARRLMDQFWPGGLTLVFEANPQISPLLTAGTGKVGIRLSSHPVATSLAKALGAPITGTSANISGQPACRRAQEVFDALGNSVDLILDGGETAGGKGSTILDVTVDPPVLLREGMVSREQLDKYLK
jgi:L-threonylcarbamoyladenylate synthase